jgi:sulfate adenylyltransferase subunit 2
MNHTVNIKPEGARPGPVRNAGSDPQTADTPIEAAVRRYATGGSGMRGGRPLTAHLRRLEAESIEIIREVVSEFRKPVMLYSIGKDSSAMLHIARKAFFPGAPPFPLLHVDTAWKFRDMIAFRDAIAAALGLQLLVHINRDGLARGINPIASGSSLHTEVMKTEALKQALDAHGFDAALGGARRDEEKSRAKERIFSFRTAEHVWDPRNQRPELWNLYNTKVRQGESVRVFPLSNWTEADIWSYIAAEEIPVIPLYFSKMRPIVRRSGALIMVDDERLPLERGETPAMMAVRFRTLGCYPLSGAIESTASDARQIAAEMLASTVSERQGRLIDHDEAASMEKKKREGYF